MVTAALTLALAPIAHGAEIVAQSNMPIKQTVITLAASTDTTLGRAPAAAICA
jgi:hypothetical protein